MYSLNVFFFLLILTELSASTFSSLMLQNCSGLMINVFFVVKLPNIFTTNVRFSLRIMFKKITCVQVK